MKVKNLILFFGIGIFTYGASVNAEETTVPPYYPSPMTKETKIYVNKPPELSKQSCLDKTNRKGQSYKWLLTQWFDNNVVYGPDIEKIEGCLKAITRVPSDFKIKLKKPRPLVKEDKNALREWYDNQQLLTILVYPQVGDSVQLGEVYLYFPSLTATMELSLEIRKLSDDFIERVLRANLAALKLAGENEFFATLRHPREKSQQFIVVTMRQKDEKYDENSMKIFTVSQDVQKPKVIETIPWEIKEIKDTGSQVNFGRSILSNVRGRSVTLLLSITDHVMFFFPGPNYAKDKNDFDLIKLEVYI